MLYTHVSPGCRAGGTWVAKESSFLSRNRQYAVASSTRYGRRLNHLPSKGLLACFISSLEVLRKKCSQVFCEISLEKRPDLWQDDEDTEEKNIERITFLATFPQTEYSLQLDPKKSTTRKNEVLAKALKEKGNKSYGSGDNIEAMNHYNQALRFASIDQQVVLVAT